MKVSNRGDGMIFEVRLSDGHETGIEILSLDDLLEFIEDRVPGGMAIITKAEDRWTIYEYD